MVRRGAAGVWEHRAIGVRAERLRLRDPAHRWERRGLGDQRLVASCKSSPAQWKGTAPGDIGSDEKKIFELLSSDEPLDIEDLISNSGLASQDVLSALIKLELKGVVQSLPGKSYVRKQTL